MQHIQRRYRLLAVGDRNRFRAPKGRQNGCKLVVNVKIVNDPELLLDEWISHFSWLAKSRRESLPSLQKLQCKMEKKLPQTQTLGVISGTLWTSCLQLMK